MFVGALLVTAMLGGCMSEGGPEAALRAAQADSAAAGYPVGGGARGHSAASSLAADLLARLAAVRRRIEEHRRGDSAAPPVVAMADRRARRRGRATSAGASRGGTVPRDSSSRDTARAGEGRRPAGNTLRPTGADTASSRPDALVEIGAFLAYNPAHRVVHLQAIAGYNGVNESMNFNGAARGARTVVLPRGWRVEIRFRQDDEGAAHSALVASAAGAMAVDTPPPAFPGAMTRRATEGLTQGTSEAFDFSADRVGEFVLQCGVPGHAQAGMWIRLVVDATATAPRYR